MLVVSTLITALLFAGCFAPRDPSRCNFIGSLIGGAFSLLGARKQSRDQERANERNRPVNQVREWEEAGINPLFGISSGGYIPHRAASIGDSYAVAGSFFQDAFNSAQQREQNLKETALSQENEKLKEQLDDLAKPRIPSHMRSYGGVLPLPSEGSGDVGRDFQTVSDIAPVGVLGGDGGLERSPVGVTSIQDAGSRTYVNPRAVDAEGTETRYGDILQELTGFRNLWKDNAYNEHLQVVARLYGRHIADRVNAAFGREVYKSLDQVIKEQTAGQPRKKRPKERPPSDAERIEFMRDEYPTVFD